MRSEKLNFLQRLTLETLWIAAKAFAVMPYWFKYHVVENLVFLLIYHCFRYRRGVNRRVEAAGILLGIIDIDGNRG